MKVTQRWRPHLSAWYFSPLASSRGLDGLPWWLSGKESACQCRRHRRCRRCGFCPWVGKIPLENEIAMHSSILAWKSHGRRSLVGWSPRGCEESDTTERLNFDFSLSCIGGGNRNPLQCSYLENPMDRGAWRATVHGITKSQMWLE